MAVSQTRYPCSLTAPQSHPENQMSIATAAVLVLACLSSVSQLISSDGVIRSEDLAIRVTPGQTHAAVAAEAGPCAPSEAAAAPDEAYCSRREQIMANFERKELERFLRQAEGNVSEAARISGIPRRTLYRKMKRFGL